MAVHPSSTLLLHATAVALGPGHGTGPGGAVVITGASGSGKSGLGLQLMAMGCRLVADDRTRLSLHDGAPWASCPEAGLGLIEARFVGLLGAEPVLSAPVSLAVDLDREEAERLPPPRRVTWLGCDVPLLHKAATPHFAAAILQYLKAGRRWPAPEGSS